VSEAITWLKEKRDSSKPFFLAVWTHEPHYPIKSDPKFKALYPKLTDDVQKEHHANVTQMDHAFGKLMKSLDEQKLTESTFVFFTSDNGPEGDGIKSPGRGSSGGLRGRKRDVHEGGIRVPGIARWPEKIKPATTCEVPVIGSDLFPTLLAAAGVKNDPSRVIDGVNILSALDGTAARLERPQPLFWRLHMAPNMKIAMRVDDWKILADENLTTFELYNLKTDPTESSDLKDQESVRFSTLKTQLIQHNASIDAEGPDWWKRLSPNGGKPRGTEEGKKKKKKTK
jgi:arylsulfatase A